MLRYKLLFWEMFGEMFWWSNHALVIYMRFNFDC